MPSLAVKILSVDVVVLAKPITAANQTRKTVAHKKVQRLNVFAQDANVLPQDANAVKKQSD